MLPLFAGYARTRRPHLKDPVLQRVLAVLDEELLLGVQRELPDEEPEREVAPAARLTAA